MIQNIMYATQMHAKGNYKHLYFFNLLFMIDNIDFITINNTSYRKVIHTTKQQQLVVMSIPNGIEIGSEIHPHTTQFIKIERGLGEAVIKNKHYKIGPGSIVVVPPNVKHNIISHAKNGLKLYTIYSPPEHKKGLVQDTP